MSRKKGLIVAQVSPFVGNPVRITVTCCIETAHHIGKKQGARSGDRGNPARVEDRERRRVLRKASRYIVHGGKRMRSHQFQDANVLVMLFQNFLSAGQAAALRSDSADVVVGNHGGTYIA